MAVQELTPDYRLLEPTLVDQAHGQAEPGMGDGAGLGLAGPDRTGQAAVDLVTGPVLLLGRLEATQVKEGRAPVVQHLAGDVVLVKGSKGSKVSVVVDAIRKLGHPDAQT